VTYASRSWELALEQPSDSMISARWVVDATGRASCFARRMGTRRYRIDNQICVSALCSTPACVPSTLRVESEQSGWWFVIPNTMHGALVSYFTDADLAGRFWTSRIGWRQRLERTTYSRSYANAVRTATVQVRTAMTEYLSQFSGPGWLAIGDAAFASDPLSSHGLLLSLTSSLHAYDAILEACSSTRDSVRSYDHWLSHTLNAFLAMRRYFYFREQRWPDSPFWQRRHENIYDHN
jgi:flavin-dependent dehydrogenase